jgi:hypothetical protein
MSDASERLTRGRLPFQLSELPLDTSVLITEDGRCWIAPGDTPTPDPGHDPPAPWRYAGALISPPESEPAQTPPGC